MIFGLIIIVITMLVAVRYLILGMSRQSYNFYGRVITRSEHPVLFWFAMAVSLLVLAIGLWMLPLWLAGLS